MEFDKFIKEVFLADDPFKKSSILRSLSSIDDSVGVDVIKATTDIINYNEFSLNSFSEINEIVKTIALPEIKKEKFGLLYKLKVIFIGKKEDPLMAVNAKKLVEVEHKINKHRIYFNDITSKLKEIINKLDKTEAFLLKIEDALLGLTQLDSSFREDIALTISGKREKMAQELQILMQGLKHFELEFKKIENVDKLYQNVKNLMGH